jgi:hypothetical protein
MNPTKPQRLIIGKGQISGYISIFLSILALASILCFIFPEKLTTPEFREIYTAASMTVLVKAVIILAFVFALISFLLSKKITWALLGAAIAGVAILLGALNVQGTAVQKTD